MAGGGFCLEREICVTWWNHFALWGRDYGCLYISPVLGWFSAGDEGLTDRGMSSVVCCMALWEREGDGGCILYEDAKMFA